MFLDISFIHSLLCSYIYVIFLQASFIRGPPKKQFIRLTPQKGHWCSLRKVIGGPPNRSSVALPKKVIGGKKVILRPQHILTATCSEAPVMNFHFPSWGTLLEGCLLVCFIVRNIQFVLQGLSRARNF